MSLQTEHYIGSTQVYPENAETIGFKLDWTKDIREAELTTDSIILSDTPENPARTLVLNHIANNGIFEGVPYTVRMVSPIGTVTLEYYIDLTDDPIISGEGDSKIEVKIKRRKAVDYFKQQADGLTWELVNTTNPIVTSEVDYLIVRDNQVELAITLGLATYQITKALIEGVRDLVEAVTEVIRASTPDVGATGPTVQVGDIIAAVLLAVARLIYVAALIIALVQLAKQIIELVFPPLKQFKVSTVLELLTKGCAYLGYTFTTDVPEFTRMNVLPKPILCPREGIFKTLFSFDSGLRTLGYPTSLGGDSIPTLGSLVDFCKSFCNGKVRITGNQVEIQRRDHWIINSGININRTLTLQSERENRWRYNTGDHWKRYYLKYQLDPMDVHTYDDVSGVYSEHSTEPDSVINPDLVLIKRLVAVEFPFSLGSRKEGLNFIENLFLPFASLADGVVNFFGGSSNLVSSINGRVGVLQISQQYFQNTKLLYLVGKKQPENFRDIIGAEQAYQKYHIINQVKENFKRIYEIDVPFSTENFQTLLDSNYVNDENGNALEVLTAEFINESKIMSLEYAVLSDEGFNTKTILIEGGGTSGTTTGSIIC